MGQWRGHWEGRKKGAGRKRKRNGERDGDGDVVCGGEGGEEKEGGKRGESKKKRAGEEELNKNLCRAKCGALFEKDTKGWVVCECCGEFWVCLKCYNRPPMKGMMTKHEKKCAMKESEIGEESEKL